MKRFFVENIQEKKGFCLITGTEAGHISRVLRMGKGDRFILMDGTGARFQVSIASSDPDGLKVSIEKRLPSPPPPPVEIILCQSILKSRSMDYMVQKTSELGVGGIIPFISERTVVNGS